MDPVSMTASVIALLQLTGTAIGYLNDVKHAPKDRADCAIQATNLLGLLTSLRYRLEESNATDPWFIAVRALAVEGGPMDQFKEGLDQLVERLQPRTGWKNVGEALAWSLTKKDVDSILGRIGRLKQDVQMALDNDHFKLSQAIKDDTGLTRKTVTSLKFDGDEEKRRRILDWLSTEEYAAQQLDFSQNREQGTGQWFLDSAEFQLWLQTPKQTLFCPGHPGTGKTILASLVVDQLTNNYTVDERSIAYAYCNYKRKEQQDASAILSILLKQFAEQSTLLPAAVTTLYDKHHTRSTRPSIDELSETLSLIVSSAPRTFFVLDALDECDSSNAVCTTILTKLRKLQSSNDVRILATSRFIPDIERKFVGSAKLRICALDADIEAYLNTKLPLLPHYQKYSHMHSQITTRILIAADGMFLLARLYLEALRSKRTAGSVKSALDKLSRSSNSLDLAYDDAIARIEAQSDDDSLLARCVLSWISLSKVEMSIHELQHALVVDLDAEELDEDNIFLPEDILSVGAGLVCVNEQSSVVGFVHYTTQEYLNYKLASLHPGASTYVALTCLHYMKYLPDDESRAKYKNHTFLRHAVNYWGNYVKPVQELCAVTNAALSFCESRFSFHTIPRRDIRVEIYDFVCAREWHPVHLLALFGLEKVIARFCERNPDLDLNTRQGIRLQSPLYVACRAGQVDTVAYLCNRDEVDVNSMGIEMFGLKETALHEVAAAGRIDVVEVLLTHPRINVNSLDWEKRTPLRRAIDHGQHDMVEVLLKHKDIGVSFQSINGTTALHVAIVRNEESIAQLLLQQSDCSINTNMKVVENGEILREKRAFDQNGFEIKAANIVEVPTLLLSVAYGNQTITKCILERDDVDVNLRGFNGLSALGYAAREGYGDVVKLLLARHDIEADIQDENGHSPLWFANQYNYRDVMNLLLERSDVDPTNVFGLDASASDIA